MDIEIFIFFYSLKIIGFLKTYPLFQKKKSFQNSFSAKVQAESDFAFPLTLCVYVFCLYIRFQLFKYLTVYSIMCLYISYY